MLSPEFHATISEAVTIPPLPATVMRLREALADSDVSAATVAGVVATDPPIAATVLKLANSAIYAPRETVGSIDQAVGMLGMRTVEGLVLQASLANQFASITKSSRFDPRDLWVHSILCGHVAESLRGMAEGGLGLIRVDPYTTGLLHDIGQFVLLTSLGPSYLDVLDSARRKRRPFYLEEQEHLGFDHAQLGSMIANDWGFPAEIVDAIEGHHLPRAMAIDRPHVYLLMLANQIANFVTQEPSAERRSPDRELFTLLGIPPAAIFSALSQAGKALGKIEVD